MALEIARKVGQINSERSLPYSGESHWTPDVQMALQTEENIFETIFHFLAAADTDKNIVKLFMGELFYLQLGLFCLQLSFFAYSPLRPLLEALSHSKQKSSNCKQKS